MIYGITLILLGIIAVPSLLLSKKPDAKVLIDKVTPYQGWVGLVFCFWGIWGIIQAIIGIKGLTTFPIWWITWITCSTLEALLGFILGYGLISKFVLSKSEEAKKRGSELLAKLAPIQGTLGMAAVAVGIWTIVCPIVFR